MYQTLALPVSETKMFIINNDSKADTEVILFNTSFLVQPKGKGG